MRLQFNREIENLKQKLIGLAENTTLAIERAVTAFFERDRNLAEKVIAEDSQINSDEVIIEEECLKILALHQPVASDLRLIIAIIKINDILETVGDLAVSIARKAKFVSKSNEKLNQIEDYQKMSVKSLKMFQNSIKSLIDEDVKLAESVLQNDDEIDKLKKKFRDRIIEQMKENPEAIDFFIRVHAFIRNLERIADMASSIAEDIIYFKSGDIVRHRHWDYIEEDTRET